MIQTTVQIEGMMCGMCEAHVNDAIRAAFSVKKVSSSRYKGETVIESAEPLDENALREAVEKSGYRFVSASVSTVEKKGLFRRK